MFFLVVKNILYYVFLEKLKKIGDVDTWVSFLGLDITCNNVIYF